MDLFNTKNYDEKLNALIRIGEVCEIDYAAGTARVVFDDDDSLVSNHLQVIQRNTLLNQDYVMPDMGEDVVCLFLSSGVEEGFILGSVYAGEVVPPETTGDKRTVVFADDTKVSYDRITHEFIAELAGGISVKISGESVEVTAPTIKLNGAVEIAGSLTAQDITASNIEASEGVSAQGVSLADHTHLIVGGGKTLEPSE